MLQHDTLQSIFEMRQRLRPRHLALMAISFLLAISFNFVNVLSEGSNCMVSLCATYKDEFERDTITETGNSIFHWSDPKNYSLREYNLAVLFRCKATKAEFTIRITQYKAGKYHFRVSLSGNNFANVRYRD